MRRTSICCFDIRRQLGFDASSVGKQHVTNESYGHGCYASICMEIGIGFLGRSKASREKDQDRVDYKIVKRAFVEGQI